MNTNDDISEIRIPLSKAKITLLFLGALAFVCLGLFMFTESLDSNNLAKSEFALILVSLLCIVFFGMCAVFAGWKLFGRKYGLEINEQGIIDNSGATSIGLIEWEDIKRMSVLEMSGTKLIMIFTHKPEKYIDKATNALSKHIMKANFKGYGSPLSITTNSLKIGSDELLKILLIELKKSRNNPH